MLSFRFRGFVWEVQIAHRLLIQCRKGPLQPPCMSPFSLARWLSSLRCGTGWSCTVLEFG